MLFGELDARRRLPHDDAASTTMTGDATTASRRDEAVNSGELRRVLFRLVSSGLRSVGLVGDPVWCPGRRTSLWFDDQHFLICDHLDDSPSILFNSYEIFRCRLQIQHL